MPFAESVRCLPSGSNRSVWFPPTFWPSLLFQPLFFFRTPDGSRLSGIGGNSSRIFLVMKAIITSNESGVVLDVYTSKESDLDHNAGTGCETVGEIVERLCAANS